MFSFTLAAMFRVIQVAIFNLHSCPELQTHTPDPHPHHILGTEFKNKCFHYQASQMSQWKTIHLPMQETQKTWVWSLGWEDALEKETATHSSILAWRTPWTKESMGSHRVGCEWAHPHYLSSQNFSKYSLSINCINNNTLGKQWSIREAGYLQGKT